MAERVGFLISGQSKVSRVISPTGQLAGQPDPKKPTAFARGGWGLELRKQ